jgi:hypothetical protein
LHILEERFGEKFDYCRFLVDLFCCPHERRDTVRHELRMFAGQILKHVVENKFVRMSERELDSSDEIKDRLTTSFRDADAGVRKLTSQIMTKMLINGGYYSWDQLIDFFIGFLKPVEGGDSSSAVSN